MATAGSPTFTPEEAAARVEAASWARRRPWRWSIAPAISGFLALASRLAPNHPEAWDPSLVLDGVFGRYRRQASDWVASP